MANKHVEVNIYPDAVKFLIVSITQIALENDKMKRLDIAGHMLDACKEVVNIGEVEQALQVKVDERSTIL